MYYLVNNDFIKNREIVVQSDNNFASTKSLFLYDSKETCVTLKENQQGLSWK